MTSERIQVEIDGQLCTGCGLCVEVCPTQSLSVIDGKAALIGPASIACGHCEAACPEGAIRVPALGEDMARFRTFSGDARWLPHGKCDVAGLVRLMASRRSCRNYSDRGVDRALLEDLAKIGTTAPSGTNSQRWTFTILPTRSAVQALGSLIASFFGRLNAAAKNPFLKTFLKLIGKGELDAYYRSYYPQVRQALEEWEESGRDRLFHGATAAIVVGSRPGASCPVEDALLATQNILLAAHSIGLGSCLIGYAVAAMKKDRTIQRAMGVPDEEEVYAVIALGYPDESYQTVARRKTIKPRYFEGLS
ncbi:MAG TPA: nitroreductase family protein [Dissulfurispiraceae bacterium]|nr:nitroreductase family protein [Dissulfurispiraceae bacterium]